MSSEIETQKIEIPLTERQRLSAVQKTETIIPPGEMAQLRNKVERIKEDTKMLKNLFSSKLADRLIPKRTVSSNAIDRLDLGSQKDRKIGSLNELLDMKPGDDRSDSQLDMMGEQSSHEFETSSELGQPSSQTSHFLDDEAAAHAQNASFNPGDEDTERPHSEGSVDQFSGPHTESGSDEIFEPEGGPVTEYVTLKSLPAVAQRLTGCAQKKNGYVVLISADSPDTDITRNVVEIAREMAAARVKTLLVDSSRSLHVVSSILGLPRMPGLKELLNGDASAEDVIKRDPETSLQCISAGNPRLPEVPSQGEVDFQMMMDVLSEVYSCVIIHADYARSQEIFETCGTVLSAAVVMGDKVKTKSRKKSPIEDATQFLGLDGTGKTIIRYEEMQESKSGLLGFSFAGR